MAWTTPKTNWQASYDENGNYTGDYFYYLDFNRIRNNLVALTELGSELYHFTFTSDLPNTKTTTGYPYASDFNAFETRLDEINRQSLKLSIGAKKTFTDNGTFIDYAELNRIESAMLEMYRIFANASGGRKMLRFTLGFAASSVRE